MGSEDEEEEEDEEDEEEELAPGPPLLVGAILSTPPFLLLFGFEETTGIPGKKKWEKKIFPSKSLHAPFHHQLFSPAVSCRRSLSIDQRCTPRPCLACSCASRPRTQPR